MNFSPRPRSRPAVAGKRQPRHGRWFAFGLIVFTAVRLAAAIWVPTHDETVSGIGWYPSWVEAHLEPQLVPAHEEVRTIAGDWEDQFVAGHDETVWIDTYTDLRWVDGHLETVWVDGYPETQWVDGHSEDQWRDGYTDDEGNWVEGYMEPVWIDGYPTEVWIEGHDEERWVTGYEETIEVPGHEETQWVDGYTERVWVPEHTEPVWVEDYFEDVLVDGFWNLVYGTWTVTVTVPEHWEGEWVWEPHHVYGETSWSPWTPDASTVAAGATFTQTRTGVRSHVAWETNEAGDIRGFVSGPDNATETNPTAVGTGGTVVWTLVSDVPVGDWYGHTAWTPDASTKVAPETVEQSRTASRDRLKTESNAAGAFRYTNYTEGPTTFTQTVTGTGTGGGGGPPGSRIAPILSVANVEVENLPYLQITPAMIPSSAQAPEAGLPAPTGAVRYTAFRVDYPAQTFNPLTPASFVYGLNQNYGSLSVTATYDGDANYLPATKTVIFVNRDRTPPTFPGGYGLVQVLVDATSVSLKWETATDPAGGITYELSVNNGATIYANGLSHASGAIHGLTASTTYQVVVRARDAQNNPTAWSPPLSVTTLPGQPVAPASAQWADVNGDGLLDEIIPEGSATFSYFPLPEQPREVTFAEWQTDFIYFPGYFYSAPGHYFHHPGEPSSHIPVSDGFIPVYSEQIVTVFLAQVMPVFQFSTNPDYNHELARVLTRADGTKIYRPILDVTLAALLGLPGSIQEWLPGGPWLESSYDAFPTVLARIARPPTGVQINLPGIGNITLRGGTGGVTGTVVLPGNIQITAGNGSATITAPGTGTVTVDSNGTVTGTANLPGGYVIGAASNGNVSISGPGGTSISTGPGGTTLTLPGGTSVTVNGSGAISLSVPGGTGALIGNAVDMLGRILGINLGTGDVRGQVVPPGGQPTQGGWEDIRNILLGGRPPGDYDVATTTDTRGMPEYPQAVGSPAPQNIIRIRLTVQQPPQTSFVRGDVVLSFLRIGHWGADRSDGGVDGYESGNLGGVIKGPAPNDFIDKDPDRFFVRVVDAAKNTDATTKQTIAVQLSTRFANGTVDDAPTAITLEETGANTGVFLSESQLLMSEDIPTSSDDGMSAYTKYSTLPSQTVSDEDANDRTHRAAVDGVVRAEFQAGSNTYSAVLPVSDQLKVLHVVVNTFSEPWQDTNGNGVYDAGEPFIDISAGATTFGTTGTRGPIWSEAEINLMMTGLRASLAQARIKVVEDARIVREPKLNLFAQPGNTPIPEGTRGYFNAWADLINGDDISRDHIVIQENFRSPQQFNASDDDDVVDIYFVAPLKKPPAPGVITYAMQFRPGLVASQALDQRMINQVFVGLTVARDNLPTTLAHELLHQLTNRPDIPTPAHIFFPSSAGGSPNDGATPLWARRIQESTAIDARTVRGSLTGSGNKLLRNP